MKELRSANILLGFKKNLAALDSLLVREEELRQNLLI
jgi:hypothetical protein